MGIDDLRAYFEYFGNILDCVVMADRDTGTILPHPGASRGFGFVTFETAESANLALRRHHMNGGKRLECKKAKPKAIFGDYNGVESNLITKKLFVGGLFEGTTEEEIKEGLSDFGTVVDVVILADKQSGSGKYFAFVTFDSPLAVEGIMQNYFDIRVAGRWVGSSDCRLSARGSFRRARTIS